MLLGAFEHTIDDKSRLTLPAKFREALSGGVVLTYGMDGCVSCYPRADWERVVEKLKTGQTPPPGGARPPVVGSMQCAFSFYRWSRRRIRMFPRLRAAKAPGNSRPCF